MPRLRFTNASVARIRPYNRPREFFDAGVAGFGVRVMPSGTKSYFAMARLKGEKTPKRYAIGRVDLFTLDEARERARIILRQLSQGEDPHTAARHQVRSLAGVVEEYAARHLSNLRSGVRVHQMLQRELVAGFGTDPIASVTKRDIIAMCDQIAETRPIMANRLLGNVKRLFAWAVDRGLLDASPAATVRRPAREMSRGDRVLTDQELARVWRACDGLGTAGPIVKLLLLTGARKHEIANLRREELDLDVATISLGPERFKSNRSHQILLSEPAIQILHDILARRSCNTGKMFPVVNWTTAQRRIHERSGTSGWTLHDLRRSAASGMARLGTPPGALARILGHAAAPGQGLMRVYNRHTYDTEARAAIEAWGRELMRIAEGREARVVWLK